MKLNVTERITLLHVLGPLTGSILEIRTIRELRELLSFSDYEREHLSMSYIQDEKGNNTGVTWDHTKDEPMELALTDSHREIISKELKKLDAQHKLEERHLPVWDKFVGSPKEDKQNE